VRAVSIKAGDGMEMTMLTRWMIWAGLALTLLTASAAHADRRVALVVGNSAYSNAASLRNPATMPPIWPRP